MRFFIVAILTLSVFGPGMLNAQQDQNNLVDNATLSNNLIVDQLNFSVDYKIDFKKGVFRKLQSGSILSLSQQYSTSSNIQVKKGTILETYSYYKNDNLYIVYYKKTWGFIPVEKFEKYLTAKNDKTSPGSYQPPKLLSKNPEKYLKFIFPDNSHGELLLNIHLTNTGDVKEITVLKSIPEIDESVIDSLKKLRFKPARRNGCPVEAQFKLPLKYSSGD